jgi:hypothetical protein
MAKAETKSRCRRLSVPHACSVLVDMTKTAGDFRAAANKALEAAADGLLPRLRPILDEVGTVRVGVAAGFSAV